MRTEMVLLNSPERASEFVNRVAKFHGELDLESGHSIIDGKSVLGVMTLNLRKPCKLHIYGEEAEVHRIEQDLQDYLLK